MKNRSEKGDLLKSGRSLFLYGKSCPFLERDFLKKSFDFFRKTIEIFVFMCYYEPAQRKLASKYGLAVAPCPFSAWLGTPSGEQ